MHAHWRTMCGRTTGESFHILLAATDSFCRESLRIGTWEHGVYETNPSLRPPEIIKCSQIVSQVGRITVRKTKGSSDKLWMTIGLDQVRPDGDLHPNTLLISYLKHGTAI